MNFTEKNVLQETLFSLYLRLNGYFVSGFIVHAPKGNTTEIDALAVRFPHHTEQAREVNPCNKLVISDDKVDFLICEVKGGNRRPQFNPALRGNNEAMTSVLNRFGAFNNDCTEELATKVSEAIQPESIRKFSSFPQVDIDVNSKIRCILVVPDQNRPKTNPKPYIYGDDILSYIWSCFRPIQNREACDVEYRHWNLWGEQYKHLVEYFKDTRRETPGPIEDIYKHFDINV